MMSHGPLRLSAGDLARAVTVLVTAFSAFAPQASLAQILVGSTVSYSVSGRVNNLDIIDGVTSLLFDGTDFRHELSSKELVLEQTIARTLNTSNGGSSTASVFVRAISSMGQVGVGLGGVLNRQSTRLSPIGEAALGAARVQARWQDTASLNCEGDCVRGELVIIHASLTLAGELNVLPTGAPHTVLFGGASAYMNFSIKAPTPPFTQVNPLPTPPVKDAYFAEIFDGTYSTAVPLRFDAPDVVPLTIWCRAGEPMTIDYALELSGRAQAEVKRRVNEEFPGDFSIVFNADFSNTVTWGGIDRVVNAFSGEVIEDWTITSASGFDYSRPYSESIPEPTTIDLFLVCVSLFALFGSARYRFKKNRQGPQTVISANA